MGEFDRKGPKMTSFPSNLLTSHHNNNKQLQFIMNKSGLAHLEIVLPISPALQMRRTAVLQNLTPNPPVLSPRQPPPVNPARFHKLPTFSHDIFTNIAEFCATFPPETPRTSARCSRGTSSNARGPPDRSGTYTGRTPTSDGRS